MKGYKLTGRGKITALCLVLMAVLLLASAFTRLGKPSPSPAAHEPSTPSLSHAELPSLAPTPNSVQTEPPPAAPASALPQTNPPPPTPASTPSPAASPTAKPTAKPTATPVPPQMPTTKTTLYFAPGTADLLVPNPSLQDYLLDSYEGLTLVVEGFASDSEGAASAEQLALERSTAVSQLLKDLGVQSYDLMSIGTYRNAQDDTETADFARVDIYFLSTGSK